MQYSHATWPSMRPVHRLVLKKVPEDVFILLDDGLLVLVRVQTSLDVTEITYRAFFLRVSRELLVSIARETAIEALVCTPQRHAAPPSDHQGLGRQAHRNADPGR